MQTVAGILVQYCTPVSSLNVRFDDGTYQNPIHHDRMELSDCARIIGLSSKLPSHTFHIDSYTTPPVFFFYFYHVILFSTWL